MLYIFLTMMMMNTTCISRCWQQSQKGTITMLVCFLYKQKKTEGVIIIKAKEKKGRGSAVMMFYYIVMISSTPSSTIIDCC